MRLVEIRQEAELQALRPSWETLIGDSGSRSIFVTWEWLMSWWESYGEPGALRALAAFDEKGKLRGLAPLRARTVRRYGQALPALTFIGDGSNDSDYLDFIVASGWRDAVAEAFEAWWKQELDRGVVLLLNEIPESSPTISLLEAFAARHNLILTGESVPCGTIQLPATWDEYLKMLRPRFRTRVRSILRDLESREGVEFGFCQDVEQAHALLPALFDLHTRRWQCDGKPGVFRSSEKRDFYKILSARLLERGRLRFSWLKWKERVLACQYGFIYGDCYFHLQEGYEPESEHWNIGIGLRAWTLRTFLEHGLREYDFLGGVGRHKLDWGAETKYSRNLIIAAKSYKHLLFCHGPRWEAQARESIKSMIPAPILAARERRLKQRASGGARGDSAWARKTVARCYFGLGLSSVTRAISRRCRISISTNGEGIRATLKRRTQPAARIVYYHRVNDDGDPFFPATSTACFEQQIRLLSQKYRVVSLAGALDHLANGSPETVVVITFDDGYRDNYRNAFPILRRFGLPATIFLSTGSVDSREPLWFERLAYALKRTDRKYIDLELDIPRRFWTRTQDERLSANDKIYGLLRKLSDVERQEWLDRILHALGAGSEAEMQDRMLTWDEVRLMRSEGVDFGGHTVSHPFLSRLSTEQARWEISECKRRIEEETQTEVKHFAYPSGRECDFSPQAQELIRSAGYRAAVTTIWGLNYASTNPLALRRGQPWEEDLAMFACKLDWYELSE